jgi:PiT family inorganic phosphate transporter
MLWSSSSRPWAARSRGTYSGGWRIMRTLGRRIIKVDPPTGFVAESSASTILYTAAYIFEGPISTTQTITGSIMGAGAVRGHRAVRWEMAGNILAACVLTIPMAALVAAIVYYAVHIIIE